MYSRKKTAFVEAVRGIKALKCSKMHSLLLSLCCCCFCVLLFCVFFFFFYVALLKVMRLQIKLYITFYAINIVTFKSFIFTVNLNQLLKSYHFLMLTFSILVSFTSKHTLRFHCVRSLVHKVSFPKKS